MKILHVGASTSYQTVNGVNYVIWLIAKEQVKFGHEVSLLLDSKPEQKTRDFARTVGINLIPVSTSRWSYSKDEIRSHFRDSLPQIVHFHSIFVPAHASLAAYLSHLNIPYIVTPHAMSPKLLRRRFFRKLLYSLFIEKKRFSNAAAITAVSPAEERVIRDYVPNYKGLVTCIYNPVKIECKSLSRSSLGSPIKKLVYLGRFDVHHKGIDILVKIATLLPREIEFHIVGKSSSKNQRKIDQIKANLPENVIFHGPVYGPDKTELLATATMYIQASRWEVFGISIAESMCQGIPCAIADSIDLAEVFKEHELGLVFPLEDVQKAAELIEQSLSGDTKLQCWSQRAKWFAETEFSPKTIAQKYLSLYEKTL